jgi:hypothetical protein
MPRSSPCRRYTDVVSKQVRPFEATAPQSAFVVIQNHFFPEKK